MKRYRIVILFHEHADTTAVDSYLIVHLARYWIRDGHQVIALFGTRKVVPADALIMHVDLSVLPGEYSEFARNYPVVINGGVCDIRKSTISRNLVGPDDPYDGAVMVKSNLNYAGIPEKSIGNKSDPGERVLFNDPSDYQVFDCYAKVPDSLATSPDVVIEKFLPEQEGELYCTRFYQFFGSKEICFRMLSPSPIVNSASYIRTESIQPDPGIQQERRRLGLDYGKLDYVLIDGQVHLLDANKTIGFIPSTDDPELERIRAYRASGIYDFLPS